MPPRTTGRVALLMAWCAGFVDAGCFLRLHQTYTSHMTGNTAHLAARSFSAEWGDAARFLWVLASFTIGLLIGASLRQIERRQGIRSAFAAVLGVEIVLLGIFILDSGSPSASLVPLIFLAAAAMGMQTVTVTKVGSLRVYTTYLTAALTQFSEASTHYLFWAWDRIRQPYRGRLARVLRVTWRQESVRHAALTAGMWAAFLAGAVTGVAGDRSWGSIALLIPMAVLAWIMVLDWRRPAALGE